jgi:sulfonate dioxygenase
MAPSLVETVTPVAAVPSKNVPTGDYKEAAFGGPKAYNQENETKGTTNQPAASYPNYLPVWDNLPAK